MPKLTKLFEPIKVGNIDLKNRVIFLAVLPGYGEAGGAVSERYINFLAHRAKGGAGLIMTGILSPSPLGPPLDAMPAIYNDGLIPSLRRLTDVVHSYKAAACAQIGLQYYWSKAEGAPLEMVGPSAISTRRGLPPPRELSVDEIHQIVDQFGEAARRAREAGFDAVEFHAGIGYFINRFLSPCTNQRRDEYGGSLENRLRFLLEVIDSAQRKAGRDYTYLCRISAEEFMEGGHTLEDSKKVASILEKTGINALDVQAGWHECTTPLTSMSVPRGAFVHLAQGIREVVTVPVIAAYRINDPFLAEEILVQGKADLVGLARALIADPEFPNKAKEGRFEDIRPCIACNHCLDLIMDNLPMACTVNPQAGKEREYVIQPASERKRVFVIGGGPGGMEAARVAALRGHDVTLFEKDSRLGGHLYEASAAPYKDEIANFREHLAGQVNKSGAKVRLGEEMTAQSVADAKPDVIVLALGAGPLIPELPGVERDNVTLALDILSGHRETGPRAVIIGGGRVGCETAEFLAQKGVAVTILEQKERIGDDLGRTNRWVVMQRLRDAGVKMETRAEVTEITPFGVSAVRDGTLTLFEADTVVIAVGLKPNDQLLKDLEGKVPALYAIGDCVEPGRIFEAIEGGFRTALEI